MSRRARRRSVRVSSSAILSSSSVEISESRYRMRLVGFAVNCTMGRTSIRVVIFLVGWTNLFVLERLILDFY